MDILGIGKNPKVKTYSYHAFLNSIIDNREILNLKYYSKGKSDWKIVSYDTQAFIYDDVIIVNDFIDTVNREGFIYRKCCRADELIVKINSIDRTNEHPILNMFISEGEPKVCAKLNKGIYRFGIHKYGIMISYDNKIVEDIPVDYNNISWFRLLYKNNCVYAYMSFDGKTWSLVNKVCAVTGHSLKIGLNYNNLGSHCRDNEYLDWLYMNYIQLRYSKDETVSIPLDYYMVPVKNFRYEANYADHYIDVQYFTLDEAAEMYKDLKTFIKQSINRGYYPVICLDEYYIPNRNAYKKYHFFHHNLVYGYDDIQKVYMTVGYADKLVYNNILYDLMNKSGLERESDIIRIKNVKNKNKLCFDIDKVRHMIYDYAFGKDNNKIYDAYLDENSVYGLKIFDELIKTDRGRKLVLEDVRISYILYEHCSPMSDRLTYMRKKGYIETDDINYRKLSDIGANMVNVARSLNLMIVKNIISKQNEEKVIRELKKLYALEQEFFSLFLCII